jgi:hypothetical protein
VTYDYTEDVSFGFLAAFFEPGDFFEGDGSDNGGSEDMATDFVSSVKVTF